MADDGAKGCEGLKVTEWNCCPNRVPSERAKPDGGAAFEHVNEEGGRAETFAAGAEHVGGADVAAAEGADVLMPEKADQEVAGGNGAEQICGNRDGQKCKEHDEGEFSR